ncbi:MAG: hypothetical protein U0324_31865 [Polyangiales bacterium]
MDPVFAARWIALGVSALAGAAVSVRKALRDAAEDTVPATARRVGSLEGVAEDTVVALQGRLCARGALEEAPLAVTARERLGKLHEARVERLYLALDDGGEVDVEGPVTVRRGSITAPLQGEAGEAVRAWVALLTKLPQRAVDDNVHFVHAVARDERVIAVGRARVEVTPGAHDGTYREAVVTRRALLRPLDDGRVHLFGDAPSPTGAVVAAGLRGGAWGAALAGIVLASLGALFLWLAAPGTAYRFEGRRMYPAFTGRAWAAELARVSPLAAPSAEAELARAAHEVARVDERAVKSALRHAYRAGECGLAHEIATAHGLWDEARDAASRCPQRVANREGVAAFAAGDVHSASSLLPSRAADVVPWAGLDVLLTAARAHLLAGDLERATRAVRATTLLRPAFAIDRSLHNPARLDGERGRDVLRCVGEHLGALRDEPGALANLRGSARSADGWCATLYFDALAQRPNAAAQGSVWPYVDRDVDPRVLPREARPALDAPCAGDWSSLLLNPDAAMERLWPGVDHALAADHGEGAASARRVDALCSAAAFESLANDVESAARLLEDAWHTLDGVPAAERAPWHEPTMRDVAALAAAANLRAGQDDVARAWLARAHGDTPSTLRLRAMLALRAGEANADALLRAEAAMPSANASGWRAAAKGDADALLRQLYASDWNSIGPWVTWGAPRVPARRGAELAGWVRWTAPAPCVTCALRRRVVALADRDLAARAYGATSPDARPLEALRFGLRRRNTAVALAALDALTGAVLW